MKINVSFRSEVSWQLFSDSLVIANMTELIQGALFHYANCKVRSGGWTILSINSNLMFCYAFGGKSRNRDFE